MQQTISVNDLILDYGPCLYPMIVLNMIGINGHVEGCFLCHHVILQEIATMHLERSTPTKCISSKGDEHSFGLLSLLQSIAL